MDGVADYNRCGGQDYKGPACCSSTAFSCQADNQWYSQCRPRGGHGHRGTGTLKTFADRNKDDEWDVLLCHFQMGKRFMKEQFAAMGDAAYRELLGADKLHLSYPKGFYLPPH